MYRHMADIIDVTGLQLEVERRAGTAGVRCHFSGEVEVPFIKGSTIYLPRLPCPFNMEDFLIIRMGYIHELAHWHNPTVREVFDTYKMDMKSNLGMVWNICEDELDERTAAMQYPGDRKALGEGRSILLGRQLDFIKKAGTKLSEDDVKRVAVFMLAQEQRSWDTYSGPICIQARRSMPEEAIDLLDTLIREGWMEKFEPMRDAWDALDLAKQLVKRLWPDEDPDEQLAKCKKKGKGKGDGEKEEGEGESEGQGERDDKGKKDKAGSKDGEGNSTPTPGVDEKLSVIPWERLVVQPHLPEELSAHASRIDWTGKHHRAEFTPASPDQFHLTKIYK